jgi:hypothetical protein
MKFKEVDLTDFYATLTYYEKAEHLLQTYEFKNKTQKKIWELHAKGLSRLEIEKAISIFKKTYKKSRISEIIIKISREILADVLGLD